MTESNYDVWSQLVEIHIAEPENLSYIRGKTNPPKESENGYEKWYAENKKVKMVVDVHESKNYEALLTLTHHLRNLECIIKGLL